jgi:hypothetical protein
MPLPPKRLSYCIMNVSECGNAGVPAHPAAVMTTAFVWKTKGGNPTNGCNSSGTLLITVLAARQHSNGRRSSIAWINAEQLI